jgi:hypothetical protein
MANIRVEDYLPTINLSVSEYDALHETIAKAHSLTRPVLAMPSLCLEDVPHRDLYNLLWVLGDFLHELDESFKTLKVQKIPNLTVKDKNFLKNYNNEQ